MRTSSTLVLMQVLRLTAGIVILRLTIIFFSLVLTVVMVMVGNLHLRGLASHATVSQAFKAYFVPFGDAGQKLLVF